MRRWSAGLVLVVCAASGEAVVAGEGVVTGTASYGQPIAMPPGAVFEATLEDVSRMDVAADVITVLRVEDADTLRMLDVSGRAFEARLDYDLKRSSSHSPIEPVLPLRGMFSYLADAASFGECLTGRRLPVAMEGGYIDLERAYLAARAGPGVPLLALVEGRIAMRDPMEGPAAVPTLVVDRFLRVLPGEQCPPRFQSATLEGTRWKLTWLEDEAIRPIEGQPEPGLVLHGDDKRLAGTDGCNRLLAGYTLEADRIRFSAVASTMISCPKGAEVARRFAAALAATTRWRVLGRQLELYDRQDRLLARFEAGTDP